MDCRQVKQLLPLWIGQDLPDTATSSEVARHLANCPSCEHQKAGLQASLDVLQGASVVLPAEGTGRSVWPKLVSRISEWERLRRRERFNGWIPASVMALAVALMIGVSLPSIQDEFFGGEESVSTADNLFESAPELVSPKLDRSGKEIQSNQRPSFGTAVLFKHDQRHHDQF